MKIPEHDRSFYAERMQAHAFAPLAGTALPQSIGKLNALFQVIPAPKHRP